VLCVFVEQLIGFIFPGLSVGNAQLCFRASTTLISSHLVSSELNVTELNLTTDPVEFRSDTMINMNSAFSV